MAEWLVAVQRSVGTAPGILGGPLRMGDAIIAIVEADTAGAAIQQVAPGDEPAFAARLGTEDIGVRADDQVMQAWRAVAADPDDLEPVSERE